MRPMTAVALVGALALLGCGDGEGGGDGTDPADRPPPATTGPPPSGTAERPPPGVACTLIACSPGVGVALASKPRAARRARLCVAGRCRTARLADPSMSVRAPLPRSVRRDGARVRVSLLLLTADGEPIQRYSRRATVVRSRPNGPRCPPVCFNVSLRLGGGELRQRAPLP